MATKRPATTAVELLLVGNPFIKKRNLEWTIDLSASPEDHKEEEQGAVASPPTTTATAPATTAAAVEAGEAHVENHLEYFSELLQRATLPSSSSPLISPPLPPPPPPPLLLLPVDRYRELYTANFGSPRGAHFVVHQHDHPVAGTHYDLRLQINETSSASWAVMYGLPGDPNSIRLNRNATETRVHCLWNHLIETASLHTGSLLIWDTGTYSILPRRSKHAPAIDPDSERSPSSSSSSSDSESKAEPGLRGDKERKKHLTEQQKLHRAFADRKIRIRLHGARLPENYVLSLRLTRGEDVAGRQRSERIKAAAARGAPRRRRRRAAVGSGGKKAPQQVIMTSSDESEHDDGNEKMMRAEKTVAIKNEHDEDDDEIVNEPVVAAEEEAEEQGKEISAMERELRELEDEEVRRTNAYTGAENTISSVHQRRWYLSLDREACGFVRRRNRGSGPRASFGEKEERRRRKTFEWVPKEDDDDDNDNNEGPGGKKASGDHGRGGDGHTGRRLQFPFYVHGVEVECSVVTGRRGEDILRDEGVVGYVNRQGWRPVLN